MKLSKTTKVLSLSVLFLFASALILVSPFDASAKTYKWKLASVFPADWQVSKFIDEFTTNVDKRTGGKVKITQFPGEQLGGYEELFTVMKAGGLAMLWGVPDPGHDRRLNILYMPYVVTNQQQANKFFSPGGFIWETVDDILNEQNVKVVSFTDLGFYEVVNNKRPIRTPADGKGIKIRIMRYKSQELLYNAFGLSGIPMDFGDAVTALQSGVIDGEGCNGAMVHALYLKGLFKYVTPFYAFYESATLMMNLNLFKDLPAEYRKIVEEEGVNLSNKQKAWLATAEDGFRKQMEKEGAQVERLTPEELKVFEKLGRGTWPQLQELIGKDLMDKLKAAAE